MRRAKTKDTHFLEMRMKHTRFLIQSFLFSAVLLGSSACTIERDLAAADAAEGPGYVVDCRDTYTSEFRPLNNLNLGAPLNTEAPLDKTIGNGVLSSN